MARLPTSRPAAGAALALACFAPAAAAEDSEAASGNTEMVGILAEVRPTVDFEACKREGLALPAQTDQAKRGVLSVRTAEGHGSAVVISPDGTALTAAHVVGAHRTVTVRNPQGLELGAEVLWAHEDSDVAVIDVQGKGHACLVPSSERLIAGADVFAIGSPADEALAFSVSKGVVSGYPEVEGKPFLQTDASINPGNSGGPLLGADGTVAAIVSWKVAGKDYEGLGFGIPMDTVRELLSGENALGVIVGGIGGLSSRTDLAKVSFTSTKDNVTIGTSKSASASVSTQYGTGIINSTTVDDICIAPCEHEFKPGVYTFVAYSDKYTPTTHKVDLRAGTTRSLTAKPQHRALIRSGNTLTTLGLTTAVVGGSLWLVGAMTSEEGLYNTGVGSTVGGLVGMGAGLGITLGTKGKWEEPAQ